MRISDTRRLGRTAVELTVLGFGGSQVGNLHRPVSDEDAGRAVAAAWDLGIRYFDTAPLYSRGLSEQRMGRALRGRPRDAYVVSTKVGRLLASFLPLCERRGIGIILGAPYNSGILARGAAPGADPVIGIESDAADLYAYSSLPLS
jgi:aryl-alcohol dehydrogenase-like predicted oxidoreductase